MFRASISLEISSTVVSGATVATFVVIISFASMVDLHPSVMVLKFVALIVKQRAILTPLWG